ncbi:MAG TPA: hypothetical protein VFP79_04485, partial [Pseudolabrys sp.]|nr:hypothetical protein [Pseudolabrys sp.]
MRAAIRTYFDGLGRIDPFDLFDLFDLPDFIPRVSHLSTRPAIRVFHQAVEDMIAAWERDLDRHEAGAANDVLMLLIQAARRFAHVRSAPNSRPAGAQVKRGCLRPTLLRYRGRPGFIG